MSKDLQRDLGQEAKFQTLPVLVFIVAIATIAAMTYVQNTLVPGFVEIAVRTGANFGGLFAVPVLLILMFRGWYEMSRPKLPTWRNGLALSSMVLPLLVWLFRFSIPLVSAAPQLINHFPHVDPLGFFATLLYSNLLAGLLAFALTGKTRLLGWSCVLLLWAGLESNIYF